MTGKTIPLLLIYDIHSPAVQNKIRKACKDYGLRHIQFSVASGKLVKRRRKMLEDRIEEILENVEDDKGYVIIVPLHDKSIKEMHVLGKPLSMFQTPVSVVLGDEQEFFRKGDIRDDG